MDKLIEIKAPGCLLLLTPEELTALLASAKDPALWRRALQRGKRERRIRAREARETQSDPESPPVAGHHSSGESGWGHPGP